MNFYLSTPPPHPINYYERFERLSVMSGERFERYGVGADERFERFDITHSSQNK